MNDHLSTKFGAVHKSIPVTPGMNQIKASYEADTLATERQRKHFVLWSGGCDSTLCLYELLDYYGADNVVAVSMKYPWLDVTKWNNEKKYRDAFKAKMRLKGDKYSEFEHFEIDIAMNAVGDVDHGSIIGKGYGLPQAIGWMFSIPISMNPGSYLYLGSIKEDDLTMYNSEYEELFRLVCKILGRDLYLRQPYLYFRKADIIERLIKYGIYDCTWSCEMPNGLGKRCNHCTPCKTHMNAILYLSEYSEDTLVKETCLKEVREILTERKKEKCAESKVEIE